MKVIKWLGILIVLLLIVVGGVAFYGLSNLNKLVKYGVETEGPKVTQTGVALGSVDIKLLDGKGELSNFSIANPEGFSSPHLFKADKILLQIDTAHLTDSVKVIKEITIDGVDIVAEQKGLTTNIQALLDNLPTSEDSSAPADDASSESADVLLMIEKLNFINNTITLKTEEYGEYQLELPAIVQNNIGSKDKGLTPAELGQAILKPFLDKAQNAAESKVKEIVKSEITDKAKEKAEEELKKQEEKLKDAISEKLGDDAESKLKSLFK